MYRIIYLLNLSESIAMAVIRISALFFIILFFSGLSGCGKTGPLYLPDDTQVNSGKSAP